MMISADMASKMIEKQEDIDSLSIIRLKAFTSKSNNSFFFFY
jgi:hypothetical protein